MKTQGIKGSFSFKLGVGQNVPEVLPFEFLPLSTSVFPVFFNSILKWAF